MQVRGEVKIKISVFFIIKLLVQIKVSRLLYNVLQKTHVMFGPKS